MTDLVGRSGAPLKISAGVDRGMNSIRDNFEMAQRLEQAGFDSISIGDNYLEVFALAGALATVTSTITIVANIATWTRTPATMAHSAVTAATISGGRFELGIGSAPRWRIVEHHGMEFDPVIPRMREYVRAVRACLDAGPGEPTNVDGKYYPTHGFENWGTRPPNRIPLHLAATQPRMTRMAAELCDSVRVNVVPPLAWVKEQLPGLLSEGMAKRTLPKPPEVHVSRFVGVHPDRDMAYWLARRQISHYFRVPYLRTMLEPYGFEEELDAGEAAVRRGDIEGAAAAVSDRMVDAMAFAGTPAEVYAKVQEWGQYVDGIALGGGMNVPSEVAREHVGRIVDTFAR